MDLDQLTGVQRLVYRLGKLRCKAGFTDLQNWIHGHGKSLKIGPLLACHMLFSLFIILKSQTVHTHCIALGDSGLFQLIQDPVLFQEFLEEVEALL